MKESTHIARKDADGKDYYCPISGAADHVEETVADLSECVEKDVTERYSGNFDAGE